jgi:PST family polysaccharide transporter
MTVGLLEMLTVIKTIAWRLSIAILTKFRTDAKRMRLAITDGMELQILIIGTLLLGFGWTGDFIVPRLFGPRWIGVMNIYPFVALSYLTMSAFNIHSAAASVLNRNSALGLYNLISVSIFAAVAYVGVSRFGILGYGYAEVATIPAYLVMHLIIAMTIGSPDYRLIAIWWIGASIGLFWRFDIWAITAPFLALSVPVSQRKLRKYVADGMKRV